MLPLANVMIAFTLFGFSYLVLGPLAWVFTTGLILGYMVYRTMYYAIHTRKPPLPFLKVLWRMASPSLSGQSFWHFYAILGCYTKSETPKICDRWTHKTKIAFKLRFT